MKRYILLPEIALLIFLSLLPLFLDCTNRKPIAELAKINPDDVPYVIAVEPTDGTSWIPQNTQLSVLFSHPMDKGSIKDAIKIYYEGFELDGSSMVFEWDSNARQCKIFPQSTFSLNAKITATIATAAKSKDGIPMKKPFTWSFMISAKTQTGEPAATPVCPARDYEILTLNREIEVEFNRQMLRSSVEGSFLLFSEVDARTGKDGDFTWIDTEHGTTKMRFTPDTPLLGNQYYTVSLNNWGVICSDLAGNLMKSGFEVRFYTIDSVIYVSGTDGSDSNEGYHRTAPVKTIKKGIEKARKYNYTVIRIEGGETGVIYEEDITLYSDLYLQGGWDKDFENYDPDPSNNPTILKPSSKNFGISFECLTNCKIDGLTIYGNKTKFESNKGIGAVYINGSSNITIKNCVLYGTAGPVISDVYGIYSNSSSFKVINTKIYGSDNSQVVTGNIYGIWAETSSLTIESSTIDLCTNSCDALGESIAIKLENAFNVTIKNNDKIAGGVSNVALSAGIYAHNTTGLIITGNTSISGGKGTFSNYGIYIDTGNSDITINNNSIVGGNIAASEKSVGVYVNNSTATISENSIIGNDTDNSPITVGINITGDKSNIIIENNQVIKGGINGNGTVQGILVQNVPNNIMLKIQDNALITGGSIDTGDTYGIRLINVDKTKIFRNVIIGGEISNNSGSNYGISFENENVNTEYNAVFNNFIVGGKQTTNYANPCYGVYFVNTKIKILNNTIDAGGSTSCITKTYGIYGKTTSTWEIDPFIINNCVIVGIGNPSHGIYLAYNATDLKCIIFNNIFNTFNFNQELDHLAGSIRGSVNIIDDLNGGFGDLLFEPKPEGNLEESNSPDEVFKDFYNYDYHIPETANSEAKNKGHNGSYISIYSEEGAMHDIDRQTRPDYDYSKIDLGADEFYFD